MVEPMTAKVLTKQLESGVFMLVQLAPLSFDINAGSMGDEFDASRVVVPVPLERT